MRKTFLGGLVAGLMLALAACGGGGGGGDGGGGSTRRPMDTAYLASKFGGISRPANQNDLGYTEDKGAADYDGMVGTSVVPMINPSITANGTHIVLKYLGTTSTIPIKDFNVHDNGILTYSGKINGADTLVVIGGPSAGLQHSNFGYWLTANQIWVEGNKIGRSGYDDMFVAFGKHDKAANFASGGGSFKGRALASAYGGGREVPLLGTATLTMANASSGTLVLAFPNFYTLSSNNINASGGSFTGRFTSVTPNGQNTTGVILSSNMTTGPGGYYTDNSITGGSYGDSSSAANEAVGAFLLQRYSGGWTGVAGAFGVKQQP